MFRQSMFLVLGLLAAFALGCEKKEEAPAAPDAGQVEDAVEEANDAADANAADAAAAVEDAAEEVEDAAEKVEDAAGDIKIPGQ